MPQLDGTTYLPQIAWLVITFMLLYVILWKVVVPHIRDVLEARQQRIEDNLTRASELKAEAEAVLAAYEKALALARAEAQAAIAEASERLTLEMARRERELRDRLLKRIAESEAAIEKAKERAIAGIRGPAAEAARAMVEKLVGAAADEAAVGSAVDRVIGARG